MATNKTAETVGAKLAAGLQQALLVSYDKDGNWQMTAGRATPAVLQPLVLKLLEMSQRAQQEWFQIVAASGAMPGSEPYERALEQEPGPKSPGAIALDKRLNGYLAAINECIATGRANDALCCFWPVTAPLLLGWWPNATLDGPDPAQVQRKRADAGVPATYLVMSGVKGDFNASFGLSMFMGDVTKAWEEIDEPMAQAAEVLAKIVDQLARLAAGVAAGAARGFWSGIGVPGALLLAGAGLLVAHKMIPGGLRWPRR